MQEATSKLEVILKAGGYSVTTPRLAVLRYLLHREPVSLATLNKAIDSIDRASVYRTVHLFQELGIIRRLNTGMKYKLELSDAFSEHHHHFNCIDCGKVTAVSEQALERFVDKLSTHYGFQSTEHQFEIQGYCKDCKPNHRAQIQA